MDNNLEKINELIKEGYSYLEEENVKKACTVWLQGWEQLKVIIRSNDIKAIEDIDENFEGIETLINWCQDLEMELENAGLENKEFFKSRVRYCTEFYNLLPETEEFIILSMLLAEAESYFDLGAIKTSEQLFEQAADEFDDYVWSYIKWGDVYWLSNILKDQKELIDLDKAERIYREGLEKELEEEYLLNERLEQLMDLKKKINQSNNI